MGTRAGVGAAGPEAGAETGARAAVELEGAFARWSLLRGRARLDYKREIELKQALLRSRVLDGY